MSEAARDIAPEAEQAWQAVFPVPMETAKDLRESVGNLQIMIAQMARLIRDTRQQMADMQEQLRRTFRGTSDM